VAVGELMKVEAEAKVGAPKGKHSRERKTYFSGYRVRKLHSRLGTLYLVIPKVRKGGYVPFFLVTRKRSEAALISLVQEAFINGVSTRKMERLARSLGIESLSASQVSEITRELDERVKEFRTRPLKAEYVFVWIDALYEKVRFEGKVVSVAIMIAYGVDEEGRREILAVEPMWEETEESWREFMQKLKKRGVKRVRMFISDAHQGIQAAIKKEWLGSCWQRCKVHFMRNILVKVSHRDKARLAEKLKQIWLQPDRRSAERLAQLIIEEYEGKYPEAMRCLEEGLEDSLQFYNFPEIDKRRISSTNVLERTNREIRRRSRVVGVFPSVESYVRLVTCYLLEYTEDWANDYAYIKADKLGPLLEQEQMLAAN
jgi:putative transposase